MLPFPMPPPIGLFIPPPMPPPIPPPMPPPIPGLPIPPGEPYDESDVPKLDWPGPIPIPTLPPPDPFRAFMPLPPLPVPPMLFIANAVVRVRPDPPVALLPPIALFAEKLLNPSFVLEDGLAWELASAERVLSLDKPSFAKETAGLLFDAPNQSSIGDVLGSNGSRISFEFPLVFGANGERDASEPSTVGSLYLMAAADSREFSGKKSDKRDDCCADPNCCKSCLLPFGAEGERDASEPSTVGSLYLMAAADSREFSGKKSDKIDDCCADPNCCKCGVILPAALLCALFVEEYSDASDPSPTVDFGWGLELPVGSS